MNSFVTVNNASLKVEGRVVRTARLDGEKFRFLERPEAVIASLRGCGKRIDLFTFMQRLPHTEPKYAYPMEWDNFAALPITTFDEWWTKQIGFKARNKAKQAEKHGVTIKEVELDENLIHGMWEIYNETPFRQGKRFPHYGMTLDGMRKYIGTFLDSSVFIGAYYHGKLIGFIKLTWDESLTQAGLMHIISLVSERDKAPTNALLVQAVRSCAERQIPYLVYSNFSYGKKQTDSLSDFKERNGFQRIEVPRYYVPVTPLGHLAFRFGLHRKLIDRVPEPWIGKLRDIRKTWYSRKLQTSTKPV